MGLLSFLRRIYTLNTLDTRFTTSSTVPQKSAGDARVDPSSSSREVPGKRNAVGDTQPPKWRTVEFYIYYFIFLTVVPMMFKVVYDMSKCKIMPAYSTVSKLA